MKPNEVCSVLGAKLISNVDGTHTDHVNHDCPKQSNHGRRNSDWSDAVLKIFIIIITLKDLHWQREDSQEGLGVIAGQTAPSVDQPGGGGEGTALKQVGMFWHIKAADH